MRTVVRVLHQLVAADLLFTAAEILTLIVGVLSILFIWGVIGHGLWVLLCWALGS